MSAPNPHQLTTCPYNMSHQVEHYRMHIHLQKCRKQYPQENITNCPFDATHMIREVEMDYHVSVCPKRIMLDKELYITDNDHRPTVHLQNNATPTDFVCSENWDDDNVASYKPQEAKKGAPIITKAKGLTPSERRVVREQGRLAYCAALRNAESSQQK